MACVRILTLALSVPVALASSATLKDASPALHLAHPVSTSAPSSSDTPNVTSPQSTRFPPRVYSFDPRPQIDPGDVIYNPDDAGPQDDAPSDSGEALKKNPDGDPSGSSSQEPRAPDEPRTEELGHPEDDETEVVPVLSEEGGGETIGRNPPQVSLPAPATVDVPKATALTTDDEEERPRSIVDVRREGVSGEVSYIIHPDNQPPPTYQPLKDLPPPAHPVAQWRPDIFMKVCCSEPDSTTLPDDAVTSSSQEIKSETTEVSTATSPSPTPEEGESTEHPAETGQEDDGLEVGDVPENNTDIVSEGKETTTTTSESVDDASTQRSSGNSTDGTAGTTNGTDQAANNHTPRYEESGSSTYQDVANFLKDIANSDGFKNAFLGDLIKNFGSLDQNAMKLIYSLLIRPLEGAKSSSSKEDREEAVAETRPGKPSSMHMSHEDFVPLERDRLPLRDRPANGYHPLRTIFPQSRPPSNGRLPIRPSYPVRQMPLAAPSGDAWRPSRTSGRVPAYGRRGDEGIDVITAPPFQTFEVVLGSSLNHDDKKYEEGGLQVPPASPNSPPLPFDKLTLGLEMPPPDALDALPPGAVLIPPSHILGRPNLPQIFNKKDASPQNEMPLAEFLPNLPFFTKPPRLRPPASPQAQDIPPRLPSFLSSLLPDAPPPRPVRPPGQVAQSHRPSGPLGRPIVPNRRRPTGPPPPVTKMTPPAPRLQPSLPRPQRPIDQDGASSSVMNGAPGSIHVPVFEPVPPPLLTPQDGAPSPSVNIAPEQEGVMFRGSQEYLETNQPPLTGVQGQGEGQTGTSGRVNRKPVNYVPDRNEDYHSEDGVFIPSGGHEGAQPPRDAAYYHDAPPEYIVNYYELDYEDYYQDQVEDTAAGDSLPGDSSVTGERYPHEATGQVGTVDAGQAGDPADDPVTVAPSSTATPILNSPPAAFQPSLVDRLLDGHQPSLDDLLGVIKPSIPPPTLTQQRKNNLQMLLQNHRMANALAEGNGTVLNLSPAGGNDSMSEYLPSGVADGAAPTAATVDEDEKMTAGDDEYWVPVTGPRGDSQAPSSPPETSVYSEHDASVTHLWNNVQLIPLAPELFDSAGRVDDSINLTSLFNGAVPLSPGSTVDDVPDLSSDRDRITVDNTGGRVSSAEVEVDGTDEADAKFMAYVLIGACCGLALLSVTGVIVIVRFKKTCGSRQIKTRTRLTDQESVENISRRVEDLTVGGESGHKLGSWFTGRNEQLGSGKLRSNMALPAVQDLKREKSSKSGSTRDLLSISSESSRSSSPRQVQHEVEAAGRTDDEEPRNSWLHDEYHASVSDLSQVTGQDLAYIPQYQQSHESPRAAPAKPHPADHQRYRPDSSVETEHLQRSMRSRRYPAQSRSDGDRLQRVGSRRGPQYISSMDSEELEERMAIHDARYNTDSELDDGTTQYDDDESREPSRYFSDSRELDDVVVSRRIDPKTMTSQELGEHLSRDLKQYQSRRVSRTQQQQQQDERDASRAPESSSQEVEGGDGSRELQRSHSQVSFSRDNVQNEVFLEFDHILRQHGQYLNHNEPPASTLGRASRGTDDTHLSVSRANTPDSIDLPGEFPQDSHHHNEGEPRPQSPPTTPPRFTPPPAPPRPPKPGHLSQPGTPSPQAGRARSPSPGQAPSSPARSSQRPVHWTSEEERLI